MSTPDQEYLKRILAKGSPLKGVDIIIPWGIPVDQTLFYGTPSITRWKRWLETREGVKEVEFTKAIWKSVEVPGLPSIHSAELQHQLLSSGQTSESFRSIKYYFENAKTMEEELTAAFQDALIEDASFGDRSAETGFERKIWRPLPDLRLVITFNPTESLRVFLEN